MTAASMTEALVQLQARLPTVHRSETANIRSDRGSFSYRYANLSDIANAVYPLLNECGLAFIATPRFVGDRYLLVGTLLHVSGEQHQGEYPLPDKGDPRTLGSMLTYGRRYLLSCLTGVVTEEDDDAAAQPARKPPATGGTRKMSRQKPPEPEPRSRETGERLSDLQLKKLHVLLEANDLSDRDAGLAYLGGLIGRELETSKDLTKAEASVCIDRLELLSADPNEPDQATLDAIERGE